ncbi:hypothetical protein GCM10023189_45400 [Nibrella saemangeumensis]|uniref:HTH araC/xylS-type domain-containing protein n=2 Tax=Nibrella saemangeumensis TaxID=1084526 RepID=A0ABP8NFV9_9BACT
MVCARCIEVVRRELERLGLDVTEVRLGQVQVRGHVSTDQMAQVKAALEKQGFSLVADAKATLVQRIKAFIEQTLNRNDLGEQKIKFSELLPAELHTNYDALSALFSASENQTLERYIIDRRLEKVKELLVYTDLPLHEIAYQTGFSSVAHLSNQFKRLTGLSPTYFRHIRHQKQTLQKATT